MKINKLFYKEIFLVIFIIIILVVSILYSEELFQKEREVYYNSSRYLVTDELNNINEGIYEEGKYPYVIFDLRGVVTYCSEKLSYNLGEKYNLNEVLQFDKSYYKEDKNHLKSSFVIEKDGVVKGFALFLVPREEIEGGSINEVKLRIFYPIIIAGIIIIMIMFFLIYYFKRNILNPIKEINTSSKAIINGNYDIAVVKSKNLKQDEVEALTYSFELMRDEIKNKIIKEEKLKKSHQELISCISHDLKTPIATIRAYGEGLRDGIANNKEKQKKYSEIIVSKAKLLEKMINDLLDHSNAEINQLKMNKRKVNFKEYFQSIIREIEILAKHEEFDFLYEIEIEDVEALIDEDRITQVIYNLIENSLKYKGDKKAVIKINVFMKYQYICIKIKDNGIGINTIDIPYIFDKFYRAEKSRSTSISGSGLGLSICKYIIEEHDGEIKCNSKPKEGTEFVFTIKSERKVEI